MSLKLNQITEAISKVSQQPKDQPRLRIQLKRLMEIDRNFDATQWSDEAAETEHAFFSGDKPGKGVEVQFSEYEAFALYLGWMLLEQGQPQSDAVMIMRRARKRLEAKHAEILRWNPDLLFREEKIGKAARPGSLATPERAVFLLIDRRKSAGGRPKKRLIEIVDEPIAFMNAQEPGFSATIIELVRTAHDFHRALNATSPSKRGRGS